MAAGSRPTLKYERAWRVKGSTVIAGVDEAGRGPLAGPVSAAAVVLPDGYSHRVLNDSKQLTEARREEIYEELVTCDDLHWSVVMLEAEEIDRINILQATHSAMRLAIEKLPHRPDVALIDGRPVPHFPIPQQAIVKGDSLSLSIAAASVIAKVTRDRFMLEAALMYPQYGFEKHKGYGTAAHLAALEQHGPCPLHRRTFAPIAQLTLPLDA